MRSSLWPYSAQVKMQPSTMRDKTFKFQLWFWLIQLESECDRLLATCVGYYDLPDGIVLSVPITFVDGKWSVLFDVTVGEELKERLHLSASELRQVRNKGYSSIHFHSDKCCYYLNIWYFKNASKKKKKVQSCVFFFPPRKKNLDHKIAGILWIKKTVDWYFKMMRFVVIFCT